MAMTVIVTRDVELRYRGFLASVMLEVAPGVYVSPNLSVSVRDRVWETLQKWFQNIGNGSVAMIWQDARATGGLRLRNLGNPPKEIWDADGILLTKRG